MVETRSWLRKGTNRRLVMVPKVFLLSGKGGGGGEEVSFLKSPGMKLLYEPSTSPSNVPTSFRRFKSHTFTTSSVPPLTRYFPPTFLSVPGHRASPADDGAIGTGKVEIASERREDRWAGKANIGWMTSS